MIETGKKIVLFYEDGSKPDVEYVVGKFYFTTKNGDWQALVELIDLDGKIEEHLVCEIEDSLKIPILATPEHVEICKEVVRIRKKKKGN